jgi:hypothetical protein
VQADYLLHQARVRFQADGQLAIDFLRKVLPSVPSQSLDPVDLVFELKEQEGLLALNQDGYQALNEREAKVTCEFLRERLHDSLSRLAQAKLVLRAGVVGWKGSALLLPTPRLSGTTRLVEALQALGAVRYSDQLAIFNDELQVIPYQGDPKADQSAPPIAVSLVAYLPYRPALEAASRLESGGQATMTLLPLATITDKEQTPGVLSTLASICRKSRFVKGTRQEAKDCAQALLELMDQSGLGRD